MSRTWEQFKFSRYDSVELESCARQFMADAGRVWSMSDTECWTEFVLDWFAATAPAGTLVNARPGRGRWRSKVRNHGMALEYRRRDVAGAGEWMLDLAHSTYSLSDDTFSWQRTLAGSLPCVMQLALEVEWGSRNAVLDDASKVAAVRSDVKVIISGIADRSAHDLQRDVEQLRRITRDNAPWLWINLPSKSHDRTIARVLSETT